MAKQLKAGPMIAETQTVSYVRSLGNPLKRLAIFFNQNIIGLQDGPFWESVGAFGALLIEMWLGLMGIF